MSRYADMCKEVAATIMEAGFTVYLARSEEYGFFTNTEEKVLVSFGNFGFNARFSGNYAAQRGSGCGCGWIIDDVYPLNAEKVREIFQQAHCPPQWAIGSNTVKLCTVESHLKIYTSSGFTKLERADCKP